MTEGLRSAPPTGPGFSGAAAAPQDAVAADVADTAKQAGARSLLPRPGWPFQWCSERVRIRSIASAIRVTQHRFSGSGPW